MFRSLVCHLLAKLREVTLPPFRLFLHLSDDNTTSLVELMHMDSWYRAQYTGDTPCVFNKKRTRELLRDRQSDRQGESG